MNKRTRQEWEDRTVLNDSGWDVSQRDSVAFNGGVTESYEHFITKAIAAFVLRENGYRVASEVDGPTGEIDVVGYAADGPPIAVEAETNPTDEIVGKKLNQYVKGQPFRDMFLLDVGDLPENIHDAKDWIEGEL